MNVESENRRSLRTLQFVCQITAVAHVAGAGLPNGLPKEAKGPSKSYMLTSKLKLTGLTDVDNIENLVPDSLNINNRKKLAL